MKLSRKCIAILSRTTCLHAGRLLESTKRPVSTGFEMENNACKLETDVHHWGTALPQLYNNTSRIQVGAAAAARGGGGFQLWCRLVKNLPNTFKISQASTLLKDYLQGSFELVQDYSRLDRFFWNSTRLVRSFLRSVKTSWDYFKTITDLFKTRLGTKTYLKALENLWRVSNEFGNDLASLKEVLKIGRVSKTVTWKMSRSLEMFWGITRQNK